MRDSLAVCKPTVDDSTMTKMLKFANEFGQDGWRRAAVAVVLCAVTTLGCHRPVSSSAVHRSSGHAAVFNAIFMSSTPVLAAPRLVLVCPWRSRRRSDIENIGHGQVAVGWHAPFVNIVIKCLYIAIKCSLEIDNYLYIHGKRIAFSGKAFVVNDGSVVYRYPRT